MAVMSAEARENKFKRYMRPFYWAMNLSGLLFICSIGPWFYGDVLPYSYLCAILLAGIAGIGGLVFWGISRLANDAQIFIN
jgi:hypothetical protein